MNDKSLGIFLAVLFDALGVAILALACVRPMPDVEKAPLL
jgi:hypothetical protein|tara:strand:- start:515 stop:634 length:120 start_codon:yes stop_codon:yes gene_type:complete